MTGYHVRYKRSPTNFIYYYYYSQVGLALNKNNIIKGSASILGVALVFALIISPANFGLSSLASADNSQAAGKAGAINRPSIAGAGPLTIEGSQNLASKGQVTVSQLSAPQTQAPTTAAPKTIPFHAGPSNVGPNTKTSLSVQVVPVNIQTQISSAPSSSLIANQYGGFEGIDYPADCFCTPPDGNIAAGPSDIVQMVNLDGKIWSKSGTVLRNNFALSSFFIAGSDFLSDPRVVYDPQSGFWFASILELPSSGNGLVDVAVSQTTDPTGAWCVYKLTASNFLPDQPRLAVSDDKVTLVASDYPSSGGWTGDEIWWLAKSSMETCSTTSFQHYGPDTSRFHIEPAVHPVAGSGDLWYVQDGAGGATGAEYLLATNPVGSISFTSQFTTTIATTSGPPGAPQPGTSTLVNTNDARILSASQEGSLITWVANDGCGGSSCVRWDIATTGGGLAQDIDFNAGKYAFYPAVSQDDVSTEFGVIFQYSSASDYPSIAFTGQSRSEPYGTVDTPVVTKVGTGPDTTGRHGDYAGIRYDGSTAAHFFGEGEYNAAGSPWNTFISENGISSGTSAPDPTTITLTTIPNQPWGVQFGISGKLIDGATGLGLGGMPITFTSSSGSVLSTVTNPDGTFTTIGVSPSSTPSVTVTVTASFAGVPLQFSSSSVSKTYQTTKHTENLVTFFTTAVPWNHLQYFQAELTDASANGIPIAGKTITWTGSAVSLPTSATTSGTGYAESTKTATKSLGTVNATANFAGDALYNPATGNTVTYLSFRHFVGLILWTPANVTKGSATTFGATLVDTAYNTNALPVPGVTITFNGTGVSGGTITGTTDANGDVIVHGVAPGTVGTWTLQANFAGNTQFQPIKSILKSYTTS